MHRALLELTIEGVETSRELPPARAWSTPTSSSGAIDIQWLEAHLSEIVAVPASPDARRIVAIAAALVAERDRTTRRPAANGITPPTSGDAPTESTWRRAALLGGLRDR